MCRIFILIYIFTAPFTLNAQTKTGQALIDSLSAVLPSAGEDTNKVIILDKISYAYTDIDADEGIKYGLQARQLAEKLQWKRGIASAYADLAGNYKSKSDLVKATYYYLAAKDMYLEIGRPKSVASVMANLCVVYLEQGNYNEALKYAFESLKIKESLNDTKSAGIVQENIGTIYMELKNYAKTEEYYTKALKTYQETGNKTGEARCLGNMAIVYVMRRDYEEALKYHWQAIEAKKLSGDKNAVSVSYSNIASVYTEQKDYLKALHYYHKALEIAEESGNKSGIALNYGNMGEVYFHLAQEKSYSGYKSPLIPQGESGNLKLSVKYLSHAVTICREINFNRPLIEFSEYLFKAHLLSGNHEKSLQVFDQYIKLKDSIFSQQNLAQLANHETKRELELKDKDIIIKDKKLEIAALKDENAGKQRLILIAGIIILVSVGSMIYMRFWNRIKQQDLTLDDISQMQSHYVRGPVARILGLMQIYNDKDISDPINKEVIAHLKTATNQLDEIVKELIAKTEA